MLGTKYHSAEDGQDSPNWMTTHMMLIQTSVTVYNLGQGLLMSNTSRWSWSTCLNSSRSDQRCICGRGMPHTHNGTGSSSQLAELHYVDHGRACQFSNFSGQPVSLRTHTCQDQDMAWHSLPLSDTQYSTAPNSDSSPGNILTSLPCPYHAPSRPRQDTSNSRISLSHIGATHSLY